jgi:hypothetical protein
LLLWLVGLQRANKKFCEKSVVSPGLGLGGRNNSRGKLNKLYTSQPPPGGRRERGGTAPPRAARSWTLTIPLVLHPFPQPNRRIRSTMTRFFGRQLFEVTVLCRPRAATTRRLLCHRIESGHVFLRFLLLFLVSRFLFLQPLPSSTSVDVRQRGPGRWRIGMIPHPVDGLAGKSGAGRCCRVVIWGHG